MLIVALATKAADVPLVETAPDSEADNALISLRIDEIYIPDAGLAACIQETSIVYVEHLTQLNCARRDIESLVGIGKLVALETLDLRSNRIADVSSLALLTSLTLLDLSGSRVLDFSPITSLTDLTHLALRRTGLTDVGFLAGLPALVDLNIGANPVNDISALSQLVHLTHLDISNLTLPDVTAISALSQLQHLTLTSTQLHDLTSVAGLVKLTSLLAVDVGIADLSPIASLTSLTNLDLRDNDIAELSPLAALANLEVLSLGANEIADLSALSTMTSLQELTLGNNHLTNVAPLAGLVSLRKLDVSYNAVTDYSPLDGLDGLIDLMTDEERPLITQFNLPTSIDVDAQSEITLSYAIEGVLGPVLLRLTSPGGVSAGVSGALDQPERTFAFNEFSEKGNWKVALEFYVDGQTFGYNAFALESLGFNGSVNVTGSRASDSTPPVFERIEIAPSTIDITNGPQAIEITVAAQDDLSGVARGSVTLFGPDGTTHYLPAGIGPGPHVFKHMVGHKKDLGIWGISIVNVFDKANNNTFIYDPPGTVTVERNSVPAVTTIGSWISSNGPDRGSGNPEYLVEVAEAGYLAFDYDSDVDATVRLYNSDGLYMSDSSGSLTTELLPGVYHLMMGTTQAGQTGRYNLEVFGAVASLLLDTDGDGIADDADGDGVADADDAFPNDAAASVDSDSDGYPDAWHPSCDLTCQQLSSLRLDNFPADSSQWAPVIMVAHVVDNEDEGFSVTGNWKTASKIAGYMGKNYRWIRARASGAASWSLGVSPGEYDVYVNYTSTPSRSDNARYRICHVDSASEPMVSDVLVDQRTGGGSPVLLGRYRFGAAALIELDNQAGNSFVTADAVTLSLTGADSDADDLPDNWELDTFGSLTTADDLSDSNGDGVLDIDELLAGTDPLAPPSIVSVTHTVDNEDAGFSANGRWQTASRNTGFQGEDYRWIRAGLGAIAGWSLGVSPGEYDVYVNYTSTASRSDNARYRIHHADGAGEAMISEVLIDQRTGGGAPVFLGRYRFATSALVELDNKEGDSFVTADAVTLSLTGPDDDGDELPDNWELDTFGSLTMADTSSDNDGDGILDIEELLAGTDPLGPPPSVTVTHIVDNEDVGFSANGRWKTASKIEGYQGKSYRWIRAGLGAVARWSFGVSPGEYDVYVNYTSTASRSTNARYRIHHADGGAGEATVSEVVIDQRSGGGTPVLLGRYRFSDSALITLDNKVGDSFVTADAVTLSLTGADSDADGLPDNWELDTFGGLTTANDSSDNNNDGVLDIQELHAGTDPLAAPL